MPSPKPSPEDAALERVRALCMAFPGTAEKLSHGAPAFFAGGKMFLTFVDDHHGDGRLAVWCKSTHDAQQRLVRGDPARFFVPPYVGVSGWVGVVIDHPATDWIELAILVEEGWAAVAPKRIAKGGAPTPRAAAPPPVRVKTDAALAKASLARVEALCRALPEAACERDGRHATLRVRKRVFGYFLDNHHGDGVIAVCVKSTKGESAKLVAKEPKRFYSPAYIGPRGYLGVRLDTGKIDWKDVGARLADAYKRAAPKTLAARV